MAPLASPVYADREKLIQTVLEELAIVAYGQPPSAPEHEATDEHVDMILAELAARDIIHVASTDFIPIEILHPLAQVIGRHVANKYSIGAQEVAQLFLPEGDPFSPENRLRAISRNSQHFAPAVPDYF
jgi:hypothetical protein